MSAYKKIKQEKLFQIMMKKPQVTYIRLAATAADKLKIGTELIIKRSSCIIKKYDYAIEFILMYIPDKSLNLHVQYLVRKLRVK